MIKSWLLVLCLFATSGVSAEEYISQKDFLNQVYQGNPPASSAFWLKPEHKKVAQEIFGHDYRGLRIRYWAQGEKISWILEEIGKEKPIRFGVVVSAEKIAQLSVLAFNESRGWEIRHDFFTRQFPGLSLDEKHQLNAHVDGITGATLSVRASTAVARWALYLSEQVQAGSDS